MAAADPASRPSLFDRAPALRELAHLPGVPDAAERGDVTALHAALERARKTHPAERRRIDELLAQPRLFLIPSAAPSLRTLNGIGTGLWGKRHLDPASGMYATILCVLVLFLPVFPIERYLVSPGAGRTYFFYGALPPTRGMRLWRRLVGGLVASAAVAGAIALFVEASRAEVHVLNALDVPVEVTLGEATVAVPPHARESLEAPVGPLHVVARRTDGRVIEVLDVDVPRFTDLVAYSVVGAAPLFVEVVRYHREGAPADDADLPTEVLAGQRFVARDGIDYVFRDPPPSLSIEGDHVDKRHAGFAAGLSWKMAVAYRSEHPATPGDSRALIREILLAEPELDDAIETGLSYTADATPEDHANRVALFRELVTRAPASVAAHRGYQEAMRGAGQGEEVLAEYRARFDREPTADHGYLLVRLLPPREALPLLADLAPRFPDHARLQASVGWHRVNERRWAEAADAYDRAARLAPELAPDWFSLRLRALVGAGRVTDAFALAERATGPFELGDLVAYARLVRLAGAAAPHPERYLLQRQLGPGVEPTPALLATLAEFQGDELSDEQLAAFDAGDGRQAIAALDREILLDPVSALARYRELPAPVAAGVPPQFAVLLAGEATRAGADELAERLLATFGAAAPELRAWLRDGVPLDDAFPELRALAFLARARVVGGAGVGALLADARAADPLSGLAARVAERWFGAAAEPAPTAAR